MSAESPKISPRPWAKAFLAFFGGLFLIALLSVPVTTRTSTFRRDPGSNVIIKTTYPRKERMFLPRYLGRGRGPGADAVRLRSAQWLTTLAVIALLGILDFVLVGRVLSRPRRIPPPLDGP